MLPISMINPIYKVLAAVAVVIFLMLGTAYFTSEYKDGQFAQTQLEVAIEQAKLLKIETDKVRANELKIANLQTQLEGSYEKENTRVNEVLLHYTDLINDGFRLRDQRQFANKPISANESTGTTNGGDSTTCSDELSAEATRFLLGFATDADKVVNQLVTCQVYAKELRQICSSPTGE